MVLLDNGRTKLLADREKRQSLYCIRCGACLNICPVYRKIGGHSFPWVYSGPIGAIITPQFMGPMHEPALPFASSLCGACAEVCPVKIDIPKVLLDLRADVKKAQEREGQGKLERLGVPDLGLGDAPSADLRDGGNGGRLAGAGIEEWLHPDGAVDECGTGSRMAEPARSAGPGAEAVPPDVARPVETLMSRDYILHKVRTALGRSVDQAPPPGASGAHRALRSAWKRRSTAFASGLKPWLERLTAPGLSPTRSITCGAWLLGGPRWSHRTLRCWLSAALRRCLPFAPD